MSGGLEILLVGGGGMMGTATARHLGARGHRVTVLTRGNRPLPPGVQALRADRRDPGSLAAALDGRRFDFTVDFLAYDAPDVERLLRLPYAVLGRSVLISSGQVYLVTEGARPPFEEDDADRSLLREPAPGTPDHAEWSYGVGKRRAERALATLRRTHGVRGVALRLPIVQGEGDSSLRLWAWIQRMLDGGPVLLPDGGVQDVRFLWAGDVARALGVLAEGTQPGPEPVFNLAQPEIVTLRAFLERVADVAGARPRWVVVSRDELADAGLDPSVAPYSGPWCSVLDPSRARERLGFEPTPMEHYLPDIVRWHLEHPPDRDHPGYAQRAREIELCRQRAARRNQKGVDSGSPPADHLTRPEALTRLPRLL